MKRKAIWNSISLSSVRLRSYVARFVYIPEQNKGSPTTMIWWKNKCICVHVYMHVCIYICIMFWDLLRAHLMIKKVVMRQRMKVADKIRFGSWKTKVQGLLIWFIQEKKTLSQQWVKQALQDALVTAILGYVDPHQTVWPEWKPLWVQVDSCTYTCFSPSAGWKFHLQPDNKYASKFLD